LTESGTDKTTMPSEHPSDEIGTVQTGSAASQDATHPTAAESSASSAPLPTIPGYAILDVLGQGGMGVVYRARDVRLGREVAVKMVASGPVVTDSLRSRFQSEARAVARLQHPHIAQVYVAETIENRPYFVMEFVDGGTLAGRIDGEPWPPRDAAELIAKLAEAIEFSHRHGIIHRDLKPGNVLLTASGEPKIADFGLAKFLDADGSSTKTGDILGTPSYMAPEQAGGVVKNIGPGCDVYALGAILYELLTGRPPFRTPDPMQTVLMVLSDEPVPPRKLQPTVPRDLETICLKCLEKSPSKRYSSAGELAADLQRFLQGEPIHARPIRPWERAVKWTRRRPAWAAVIALGIIGVVSALGAAVWHNAAMQQEIDRTERQRDRAERQVKETEKQNARAERLFANGRELVRSLVKEHFDALDRIPGSTPERVRLIERIIAYLDAIAPDASDDDSLLEEIAESYEEIADMQGNPYHFNLGDRESAMRNYRKAYRFWRRLTEAKPDDVMPRVRLAQCRSKMTDILFDQGEWNEAEKRYREVAAELRKLRKLDPDNDKIVAALSNPITRSAEVAQAQEEYNLAEQRFEEAFQLWHDLKPDNERKKRLKRFGMVDLRLLKAVLLIRRERLDDAEAQVRRALKTVESLKTDRERDAGVTSHLAAVHLAWGDVESVRGKPEAARRRYKQALQFRRKLAGADPRNLKLLNGLIQALERLADSYTNDEQLKPEVRQQQAVRLLNEAVPIAENLVAVYDTNLQYQRNRVIILRKLGEALIAVKKYDEAEHVFRRTDAAAKRLIDLKPELPYGWKSRVAATNRLASLAYSRAFELGSSGRTKEAFALLDRSIALFQRSLDILKDAKAKGVWSQNLKDLQTATQKGKAAAEMTRRKLKAPTM